MVARRQSPDAQTLGTAAETNATTTPPSFVEALDGGKFRSVSRTDNPKALDRFPDKATLLATLLPAETEEQAEQPKKAKPEIKIELSEKQKKAIGDAAKLIHDKGKEELSQKEQDKITNTVADLVEAITEANPGMKQREAATQAAKLIWNKLKADDSDMRLIPIDVNKLPFGYKRPEVANPMGFGILDTTNGKIKDYMFIALSDKS
jgi:hypothetical protein